MCWQSEFDAFEPPRGWPDTRSTLDVFFPQGLEMKAQHKCPVCVVAESTKMAEDCTFCVYVIEVRRFPTE